METWRDRLKRAMAEHRFNMKSLSLAAGLGETAVRDALERRSSPRLETLQSIAGVLGMTVGELVDGDARSAQRVPILGYVSAGEGWLPFDDEAIVRAPEELPLSVDGPGVALSIRGDSMAPVYRDGDFIIGSKRTGPMADNLIGLDCIVMTDTGERYVKFLSRGSVKGRFNLRSYNPVHKDVENVRLAWAAPIVWVRRAQR
jgi:phage repressor protein C with HTH and peptisase S24 domain